MTHLRIAWRHALLSFYKTETKTHSWYSAMDMAAANYASSKLSTLSYTIYRFLDCLKLNEISWSPHVLQVSKDPNGVSSIVHTVRQRRPGPGFKPGKDKTILNETVGSKTVERDGRCEYRRKQMSIMRQQQAFHGE